eukprot:2338321-Prymnesium_polylepis.1
MFDGGHGPAAISRRGRSRASPSARSSTSRTILNVRSPRLVDDLDGLRRPVENATLANAPSSCHAQWRRQTIIRMIIPAADDGGPRGRRHGAAHAPRQRLRTCRDRRRLHDSPAEGCKDYSWFRPLRKPGIKKLY